MIEIPHTSPFALSAVESPSDLSARWQRVELSGEQDSEFPRLESYQFSSCALPQPESRMVSVYLPREYDLEPARRFPVFYLHDGQNLFDPLTSYIPGRTWRAHTTADELAAQGTIEPVILVGIANTGLRRMPEYTPTRDARVGGGEGAAYARMLIDELKPLVDATYRTSTGRSDTAVGGSSLGGLISLYLGIERPDVFGKLAVMSPSIWWDARSILAFIKTTRPRPDTRIWLDMGTAEGARHLRDAGMLHRLLLQLGWRDGVSVEYFIAENAVHDENAWAARFGRVLRFLFGTAASGS